jgi:MFS family permease
VALACFTLPGTALGLAALVVVTGAVVAGFWAPAMAMLADAAELGGLEQGFAAALVNMAWASGQTLGAVAGGAIAKGAGDEVPMGITAGLCVVTLLIVVARPARSPAAAAPRA